jgi:hypothetical protein
VIISKIYIVSFRLFLIRSGLNKLNGLHRARLYTGLLATYPTLFIPMGTINAEVALAGYFIGIIPDRSVGVLGTHLKTGLTPDAFFLVNPSDIAVLSVHIGGSFRAILDTDRCDTLTTRGNLEIIREFPKGILYDLYAGERQTLFSMMN